MTPAKLISRTARLVSSRYYSVTAGRPENLWTPDNIVISPYKDVQIPETTIPEHVWQNMEKWANKTAVICSVTKHSYTYDQLYKFSRIFAASLRSKLRIKDGDVISIMMHNSPDYILAVLGILQAGAELTTVNPIYTAHEVHRQLTLSNPKVIIGSPETILVIKDALKLSKKEIPIITVTPENLPSGTISFKELIQDANIDLSVLKEVRRKSEDVALLPYSSGTTGLPKGVELTHRNIVVNCIQQDIEGVKQYHDTTSSHQDSLVAVLPFYHIYGLSLIMLHKLSVGAKIVSLPRFKPNTLLEALKEQKINLLYAVPPIILFLGSHADAKKEHLDSVQRIISGAAPLAEQDMKKCFAKTRPNTDMIQVYGLTETSPLASAGVPGTISHSSSGYPVSNTQMKIIDEEGRTLGPNQVGELLIRGPQIMKGYRDNPEATKASINENGWFKSGDLATLREDGTLFIADRLKELIKVKGYQVPPAELESVLKEHPAVLDAGVVGIPDPRTGEAPKAFVVLKDGHNTNCEEIIDFVKERVAEFKRVKEVMFLDSLPKNPSGKLLRRSLKEKYC